MVFPSRCRSCKSASTPQASGPAVKRAGRLVSQNEPRGFLPAPAQSARRAAADRPKAVRAGFSACQPTRHGPVFFLRRASRSLWERRRYASETIRRFPARSFRAKGYTMLKNKAQHFVADGRQVVVMPARRRPVQPADTARWSARPRQPR